MSNTFFVHLPSNSQDYAENAPNKFRVRLPKPLHFNGSWMCGLHSINYAYSWASTIGTLEQQWINIHLMNRSGEIQVNHNPVPKGSLTSVENLKQFLNNALKRLPSAGPDVVLTEEYPLFSMPEFVNQRRKRKAPTSPPSYVAPKSPPSAEKHADVAPKSPPSAEKHVDVAPASPPSYVAPKSPPSVEQQKDAEKSFKPAKAREQQQTKKAEPSHKPEAKSESNKTVAPKTVSAGEPRLKISAGSKPASLTPLPPPASQAPTPTPPSPPASRIPAPTPPPPPASRIPAPTSPPASRIPASTPPPPPASRIPAPTPPHPPASQAPAPIPPPPPVSQTAAFSPSPSPSSSNKTTVSTGPPPKQRKENLGSRVAPLSPTPSPNKNETKAAKASSLVPQIETNTTKQTSPPRVVSLSEPPKQRNEKSLIGDKPQPKSIYDDDITGVVEFKYLLEFQRFQAIFHAPEILFISFTPQLGYVLGFENPQKVVHEEIAKYGCDLRGGFSSFAVYTKGLTENMIIGNSLSSLLRVVSVSGAVPGEYAEKIYDSPLYARVLPKEVSEIEIELRTMSDGRLVPFSYGTVMIVLIFKKVINF